MLASSCLNNTHYLLLRIRGYLCMLRIEAVRSPFGGFTGLSACGTEFISFAVRLAVECPGVTRGVGSTFTHMQNS